MLIYACDQFVLPLPATHRFPMRKYADLAARVLSTTGPLLRIPEPASDATLIRAHHPDYVAAVASGTLSARDQRRIGFPWSEAMVERARRSVGATIDACRSALDAGCGINLAGGTHHAHRTYGCGFCVFNDAAVAIRTMQHEGRVRRALVVDLDVHQGDGTAAIFSGDDSVTTLSLHGRNNFPFRKSASTLDVELDDGTGDDVYLATLRVALDMALEAARPDLAIFLAGADPFVGDRLGKLALTKAGLAARDTFVLDTLQRAGIPVAIAMAGGYAESIEDIVDIHFTTVNLALARFAPRPIAMAPKPAIRARVVAG